MRTRFIFYLLSLIVVGKYCYSQGSMPLDNNDTDSATTVVEASKDSAWDVAVPFVPSDTIYRTVNEGTWLTVDIHPDGSRLVFDLLGDIYTVSIAGGEATLLSGGLPYEVQPRYSPDGKRIVFTSDRGGGDNIWVMNGDGSDRRAITDEDYRLLNNAVWRPGGMYVVARKHFTSNRSIGAGEMWLYNVREGGSGVQLTERKNDQQDAGEPAFSPDGRYLYWSEDMSGGSTFEYNKDPNQTIYVIRRLDMETDEIRDIVRLSGGAARPVPSPDGKQLAFVRRVKARSVLCLYDLQSGEVTHLWGGLDHDQQETWAIFGVYPGFDWMPDGKSIVIWAQGKIWRVDVHSGQPSEIPFTANIEQIVSRALRFHPDICGEQFDVKVIRWPQMTHDESRVIFQALGYLHEYDPTGGIRKRLTRQSDEYEFAPSISSDGESIVYVTWNDRIGGRVKMMNINGGSIRTVVNEPGHYVSAAASRDGKTIVYHRGRGDAFRGRIWDDEPGIYLIDSHGKTKPRLLTREGRRPLFSKNGKRIYLVSSEGEKSALISVNLLGSDRRVHAVSERAIYFRLSPDENWLAFEELWQTYVVPFPGTPGHITVSPDMKNLPVRKLSKSGGTYVNWSPDSRAVRWSLGPELSSVNLKDIYRPKKPEDSAQTSPESDSTSRADEALVEPDIVALGWREKRDIPSTDIYLVGGTILPMMDMSVISNGVIHVKDNRIVEIGVAGDVPVPENANTLDISGKTVMPGFVDVHAHVWSSNQGVYSQQNWSLLANIAFGVTTIHDPSNNTQMIFAASELVQSGQLLGPRVFSTGTILYGAEGDFKTVIKKYEDARNAVERTKAWGAFSVKSYQQPRREQRQMVIKAGYELDMMVIPEGGSTLHQNITQLLDGHTTLEHNIPIAPLYDPELWLLSRFGTGYTPTLVVAYGAQSGERYWYQHTNVWENERLSRFVPRWIIDPNSRRRTMSPDDEYWHFKHASTAADVVHRGGNVQMGSHGQMQGLAAHWEIWMFAQGGMTNHEALRAASWMGARTLGLDDQLGSLAVGKLADLIVIDGDPLADIRLSQNIAYTMINGRLFDGMTLEQLQPEKEPLPPGPFVDEVRPGDVGHGCFQE